MDRGIGMWTYDARPPQSAVSRTRVGVDTRRTPEFYRRRNRVRGMSNQDSQRRAARFLFCRQRDQRLVGRAKFARHAAEIVLRMQFIRTHFRETSFVAEYDFDITGFLNGFFSQTFSDEAYIHFVGVHPDFRKHGVARMLYEKFFAVTRAAGRNTVRCVTSPVNKVSVAFHQGMGFEIETGDVEVDGISAHSNYDGKGESRVLFFKRLESGD